MGQIQYKSNYFDEGISRLPEQFKNKPRVAALLQAWLTECQELEDAMWQVIFYRELQRGIALGDLLDKYGIIVGQDRQGTSDAIYLILITAKIQVNRSVGRRANMITIASLLAPGVRIVARDFPVGFYVFPYGPVIVPPQMAAFDLEHAIGAGIPLMFVWTQLPIANTFLFGTVYSGFTPSIDQSLDSVYDATHGGALAGVFSIFGGSSS